jgi:chromosome segregation ATPase
LASRKIDIDKHNLKNPRTVSSFKDPQPPNAMEDMIKLQEQVAKLTNKVEDLQAEVSEVGELREQIKILQINTQATASSCPDTQHLNAMEDIMKLREQVANLTNKVLDLQAEVSELNELREQIKILQGQKSEDLAQIMETRQPMQEHLAFLSSKPWNQRWPHQTSGQASGHQQVWHKGSDWRKQ